MGRFGLVFPGKGAQLPDMGQDLYRNHQGVRERFAKAGNVLGKDVAVLCFAGPQDSSDLTTNTQIVVLAADLAGWRAFPTRGDKTRRDGRSRSRGVCGGAQGCRIPGLRRSRDPHLQPIPPLSGTNEGSAGPADRLTRPLAGADRL